MHLVAIPRTQIIGLTICALAHEIDKKAALDLFILCIAPVLFDRSGIIIDALRSQLNDESHLQRILNEGASRGLTDLFTNAANGLKISFGDRRWLRETLRVENDTEPLPSELLMVGGLLKWLFNDGRETYYTRSGLVARIAAYLREVGYKIGRIESWNGIDSPPRSLGSNAVVVVIGGSSKTDSLMLDPEDILLGAQTRYYQFKTVGAMFLDALNNVSDFFPEAFQDHFETVFAFVKAHLNVQYGIKTNSKVVANLEWKQYHKGSKSIERRLAAIYFPRSAKYLAHCYAPLAMSDILDQILTSKSAIAPYEDIPHNLALFRVISAAIVLAMASRLTEATFESVQHSITLELGNEGWLIPMCNVLDGAISSALGLHHVVSVLAAVHTGYDPDLIQSCSSKIIAWRRGIFAVVPSILLSMKPTQEAIGFQCLDQYWANVAVREDGSVRDATTGTPLQDMDLMEEVVATTGPDRSTLDLVGRPWFGLPQFDTPDRPLYLSIERPLHYSDPDLCFVGRIDGSAVGSNSIEDTILSLVRSFSESVECRGHVSLTNVVNLKSSHWVSNRNKKPVGEEQLTFIPVSGNPSWALFLAGEAAPFNGHIVSGCVECSVQSARRYNTDGVLVGYQGE